MPTSRSLIGGVKRIRPVTRLPRAVVNRTRKQVRLWRARRYVQGPSVLTIEGRLEGQPRFGTRFGTWTLGPTVLYIGASGYFIASGSVEFFGNNVIRVDSGSVLSIGDGTVINKDTDIVVKASVTIGRACLISEKVYIRDNDGHEINGVEGVASITICDHVWIGHGATILKGVEIGTGAVVAAGAVVTDRVQPRSLVGGNPATTIKTGISWQR